MLMDIDSMFESAKMLFDYCTKSRGYNLFIIDEVDSMKLMKLSQYIQAEDKVNAVLMYREIDRDIDRIRDYYCYNHLEYKSSFRQIAKDMYRELKESWLLYSDEFKYIGRVLRFISTSDYYTIREYLMKRSYSFFYMERFPMDPSSFYCGYVPLEALMDYIVKVFCITFKTI